VSNIYFDIWIGGDPIATWGLNQKYCLGLRVTGRKEQHVTGNVEQHVTGNEEQHMPRSEEQNMTDNDEQLRKVLGDLIKVLPGPLTDVSA
jgi:hypothetical protein